MGEGARSGIMGEDTTGITCAFAQTRHARIHYRVAGEGVPLLLFHINRQSSDLLAELMTELAPDFRVVAMDYPGYGRSGPADDRPTIELYARTAHELIHRLGHDRAFVLGEAVGSAVAASFAAQFPDETSGAVLVNCPLLPKDDQAALVASVRRASGDPEADMTDPEPYLSRHADHAPMAPSHDWLERVRVAAQQCRATLWQAADALLAFDLRTALARMAAPSLLLTGEFSPFRSSHDETLALSPAMRGEVLYGARFSITWERAADTAARTRTLAGMT